MRDAAGIPFGHYSLTRRLARGGMAEVFLARQRGPEGFDRHVAIKRILPHLAETSSFVGMFLDEARLAARLSHPNIVHIYEFGKVGEHYFIAMEYVGGVHAGALINRGATEPIPFELVARIGADACSGLHYAHGLGDADGRPLHIVHRDVSPQNLMISHDGVVKLVDFGIAKARSHAEQTRPGVVKGKYAYMSPEQTRGKKLDGRSDVFSLAVVLWEMIAGRIAIDRSDPVVLMQTIRDGRFPDIRTARPDTPPALVDALRNAMHVEPEKRATAYELGVALEAFIKASPRLATSMQVAEFIRSRFPRAKSTGNHAALPAPNQGTRQATMGAGTAAATGFGTMAATGMGTAAGKSAHTTTTGGIGDMLAGRATSASDDFQKTEITRLPPVFISARPSRDMRAVKRRRVRIALAAAATVIVGASLMLFLGGGRDSDSAATTNRPADARAPDTPDASVVARAPVDAAPAPADAAIARAPVIDAAPPPADARPRRAVVEVITVPDNARVQLTGKGSKPAPAKFEEVESGEWKLRITKRGYKPLIRRIQARPGEHLRLEYTLDRARVYVAPRRYGRLTVRTRPYSVVYLGSRKLGMTPFANVTVPAGSHVLTFRNPKRRVHRRRVTIRQGLTTKLNFTLPR